MNHDACHCLDYDAKSCPKECYRAKLTKEYRELQTAGKVDYYTPWSHFRGAENCSREKKK